MSESELSDNSPANDEDKYQAGEVPTPQGLTANIIVSSDTLRTQRIPPGQARTRKWPVLQYGAIPVVRREDWRFVVQGEVSTPLEFTWDDFQQLPRVQVFADFHCVTRWSRLGNLWEGVSIREILRRCGVKPTAKFVVAHGADDSWTTNMPFIDFDQADVLLADKHDGDFLSADHGGPVRLIVPRLYAWKSAKWCTGLTFLDHDEPGVWEQAGYHNHGDPWTEERMWK